MAGESARELARRRREKAENLQRVADDYQRGAEGEEATALALAALPSAEWTTFHDVAWPGRGYANVNHVVVGPGGVFVIDTGNWSGNVKVAGDVLRQNGRSRDNAVVGATEAALAVAGLLPDVEARHVHPVLCFVREGPLTGRARDVMVCSTANLVPMIASSPAVLGPVDVRTANLWLDAQLRCAMATRPKPADRGARATTSKTRQARKPARGLFIRAAVTLALLAIVAANPQLLSAVADDLGRLVTSSR